jgi:L-asparaginase
MSAMTRVRVAHLAGPTATIQNTPPLVTSNKARRKYGLPPRLNPDGSVPKFDALRLQRLAAPAKVYVEQFSAHALESDAAEMYGPPDGYLDAAGSFHKERTSPGDKAVYEIELQPEDGLYPLPYMATQADGSAWEEECPVPFGVTHRQGFYPDGSRSFEEIDRTAIGIDGVVNEISAQADVDFFRSLPPGGFTKGVPKDKRTDQGEGDILPETPGGQFFFYKPFHLSTTPPRPALAKAANDMQAVVSSGKYDGAIWTQGSPQVEECAYWFNLLVDTTLPICCNSAQRPQGQISNDGPKNLVDSVAFIRSGIWKDAEGRNRAGVIAVQEQQYFAAREVYKSDARPGNYRATGGHGGIVGQTSHGGNIALTYIPAFKHTYLSDVNITRLPETTKAVVKGPGGLSMIDVMIKKDGKLLGEAIPSVSIVKDGGFGAEEWGDGAEEEVELKAALDHKLGLGRLGGFVTEGLVPYGMLSTIGKEEVMQRAVFSGLPVVRVARGAAEGFADLAPYAISGSNLTSIKARLLLMAALMKLGSLPIAADPIHPTEAERAATREAIAAYQQIFWSH